MGNAIILLKRRFEGMPSARRLKQAGFHLSSAVQVAEPDKKKEKAPCRDKAAEGEDTSK